MPLFDDPEKWEKEFESPERDKYQKPDEIIKAMGLSEESVIADLGSATGYFPIRFAKVASKGKVFALDIEPKMVEFLKQKTSKLAIPNIQCILSKGDNIGIPEPVDFIFLSNTYHHIENRPAYFKKISSSLKDGGKIVINEYLKERDYPQGVEKPKFGPPESMRLSSDQIEKELQQAGFKLSSRPNVGTPFHFLVIFEKQT